MKLSRLFPSFLFLLSSFSYGEDFQASYDAANSPEEKIEILFKWSDDYAANGDYARALNRVELARNLLKDVESLEMNEKVINKYTEVYNVFVGKTTFKLKSKSQAPSSKSKPKETEVETKPEPAQIKKHTRVLDSLTGRRPVERRMLSPLSMGHLNGFNTMLSLPEMNTAFLLPTRTYIVTDINLNYGQYKESESNGTESFNVDTSITRALIEVNMPYFYLFGSRNDLPLDFKIGLPVMKWNTKPNFNINHQGTNFTLLNGGSNSAAMGDMFIDAKWSFASKIDSAFATALRLKLPTGSNDKLTGTGSTDVGVSLLYSGAKEKQRWNFNLGYVFTGDSDIFDNVSDIELKDVYYFSADYGYNLWDANYLMVGFDYHENAFENYTEMSALQDAPMSAGLGLAFNKKRFRYYGGFKSGLNDASADTQFLFSIRMNY